MDISEEMLWTEFNYTTPINEEKQTILVDRTMIQYNMLYNSVGFYEAKFTPGWENIPGFDAVIQGMSYCSIGNSPLLEYEKRISK